MKSALRGEHSDGRYHEGRRTMDAQALIRSVDDMAARVRSDLERLVRCASVSAPGFPREPVLKAADEAAAILREAGCPGVELVEIPGGAPLVHAEIPAPPGAPTVMLYAHYDVQPAGDENGWTSPPFEPTLRGGRLYGRGAADDKSGVVAHAATLRAFGGKPPVGIKIVLEGEEETDSHLDAFVREHPDLARADVMLIADVGNFKKGEPTLTTSLRGLASCTVAVKTLRQPVHSGMFGGPAADALMVLIELLATLLDEKGDVAVAGLQSGAWDGHGYPEDDYRATTGVLDGVPLIGSGSVADRLWAKPSINVIGLDAPSVAQAANALLAEAKAIVSMRVPPAEDPERARRLLAEHLRSHAPWGVAVTVEEFQAGQGFNAATDGPGYRATAKAMQAAYGKPASTVGQGGSIPLVSVLAGIAPGTEILLAGAQDEKAAIHSIDESVDLEELQRVIKTQVLLLAELAGGAA
jgi:acetylornithine deacetylase/succinyl-diaminopimelate desuccinylase-like protein